VSTPAARILVVEDEAEIRRFVRLALERDGFEVFDADGVERGLIEAGTRRPDLLVLDLGLPDGDGVDLVRHLRTWSGMPILVLSARTDERDKIEALDAGADDYLVKPISIDELAARLRAIGRRSAGRVQAVWRHGALTYDPASREISWQGAKVDLTPRESALLEVLLSHPQRVLSKALLQEKLYDWSGGEPESNALEVHIHHLRRKIHPGIVRTVRGVGYALGPAEAAE
jgi:two-component system response regulator QseB